MQITWSEEREERIAANRVFFEQLPKIRREQAKH